MTLKPWREVATPHRDVLNGTFQQSEFAADLTAVKNGKAPPEYQEAAAFFERTFITEGMRSLLTQVAERLASKGGEPVIQLQTAFGGGKTHTLLAVFHLATRSVPLSDLAGIPPLIDKAGLTDVPRARVAVLDGTAHAPNIPAKRGKTEVRTLWGELAWQLGGAEAFERVAEADKTGTSPGKDVLVELLSAHAPCVVLVDELLAYIRQFGSQAALSGGTYDSNLSFVQALTEAMKLVPSAILLASLPESELEAGSAFGITALKALEKTFGRVQALWKPVATEEAFEIVRRRLFEPVTDTSMRDHVCRAFADLYIAEGQRAPAETQEARYLERLQQAYPIHPEVFDRLYEDWTTLDGFQRTRGVLKLMALCIHRLWADDNRDLFILPGSLPLYDSKARNDLVSHLGPGWDAVIDKDIDGPRAETTEVEKLEPRFGKLQAARKVARAIFFGSAPASVATKALSVRGIERARIMLGCLQPNQERALYADALNRLVDRLHYLNASGDRLEATTRYWFDTRANLRREMEERKRRFDDTGDVQARLNDVMSRLIGKNGGPFEGVHVFVGNSDVPDDSALRLVVLTPEIGYLSSEPRFAEDAVHKYLKHHGNKPRHRQNRLLFLVGEQGALGRLKDMTKTALAWRSIIDDVDQKRLNLDSLRHEQAKKEYASAEAVLPKAAREAYRWLLCPVQDSAQSPTVIETHALNTTAPSLTSELSRLTTENELVIGAWSPVHLKTALQTYWRTNVAVGAMTFWDDSHKYLFLPRLQSREVLANAVREGASKRDFFGTAHGKSDDTYEGFGLGEGNVQLSDTLLLIEPQAAAAYEAKRTAEREAEAAKRLSETAKLTPSFTSQSEVASPTSQSSQTPQRSQTGANPTRVVKSYHGTASVNPTTAKRDMVLVAEELIAVLTADPSARVRVTIEIEADFGHGVADNLRRAVSENAKQLSFKTSEWE